MKITNTLKEKSQEICSLFAYAIAATLITSPLMFAAPSFQSSQGYNILSISTQKTAAKQNQDKKESVAVEGEGHVLPPSAKPRGYSLTALAKLIAPFQDTLDPSLLPKDTPFQILYIPSNSSTSNSFTVPAGTPFYVPFGSANDSPPFVSPFPSTRSEAVSYFFDPSQFGGHDFKIIVDGESTPIGPEYLAGPVTTPPLFYGGTHSIVLGVFLSPLSIGRHTVEIKGQFDGAYLMGQTSSEDITYTVNVVPH